MAKQFQGTYNPEIESQKQFLKAQVKPLKLYPFVYLLLSIFPAFNRIQNWMSPGQPHFWLYVLHSLSSPMLGFMNAAIYASNTDKGFWNQCNMTNVKRAFRIGGGWRGGVQVFEQDNDLDSLIDDDVDSDDSGDDDLAR
jgi:hypothetical protein